MPSEPLTDHKLYHAPALAPVAASIVVASSILTIYVAQLGLVGAGLPHLAAAALADVAVIVGLAIYARVQHLTATHVGVRRSRARFLVAATLIGLSAWYINHVIVVLVEPPGDTSHLERLVDRASLAPTLLAIAVLPAIAEELVFRGILLRALASRIPPAIAIVLSSVVFSLYHGAPAQIVSTLGLGFALAYITLRARSVVPAMLAHFLNNTVAIVVSRDEVPAVTAFIEANTAVMLVVCALLVTAGLVVAAGGPRERG